MQRNENTKKEKKKNSRIETKRTRQESVIHSRLERERSIDSEKIGRVREKAVKIKDRKYAYRSQWGPSKKKEWQDKKQRQRGRNEK